MIFLDNVINNREYVEEILEKALTRQTAKFAVKKPWHSAWVCPSCKRVVSNGGYCKWCGQRIKFPEVKK